jgi:hypothetical protein
VLPYSPSLDHESIANDDSQETDSARSISRTIPNQPDAQQMLGSSVTSDTEADPGSPVEQEMGSKSDHHDSREDLGINHRFVSCN